MSRRRYICTDISLDTKVNKLAIEGGDFAALLYTWLIPHAGDDGIVTGDAEEILFKVAPGRRDKTPEDIDAALRCMDELGLVCWRPDEQAVYLRASSFYKYQTYIQQKNRRPIEETVPYKEDQRKTPQNGGDQRGSAQKGASPTPSLSPSPSPSRTTSNVAVDAVFSVDGFARFRETAGAMEIVTALLSDLPDVDIPHEAQLCSASWQGKGKIIKSMAALDNWCRRARYPLTPKRARSPASTSAAAKDALQSQLEDAQRRSAANWGTPLPNGAHHA